MSILINARGSSNYTITRFGKFFSSSSYYAQKYVSVNNSYFTVPSPSTNTNRWRYTYGNGECDTIMIRAEIKADAVGYIYGFKTSSAEMSIQKYINNDGVEKIKWTIGSNSREIDWVSGVHVYGFTSSGFGYYDGTTLGKGTDSSTSLIDSGASGTLNQRIIIGGIVDGTASNAKDCIHITGSAYCIDIYEVIVNAYNESTTYRTTSHLYAASYGTTDTTPYLYEPFYYRGQLGRSNGKSYTGVTGGGATSNTLVTYGVQLHDLKFVNKSAYRDLVALICEDASTYASADADEAYTITGPNGETFSSAFMLKGNNPNTLVSTNMPLPDGWSHETGTHTRSNTRSTILGDLIYGRTPKWKLWADNINVGKRVVYDNGYKYVYNIFLPLNGQQKPNLEQFEGYTTSSDANNPPGILEVNGSELGTYEIEYHNGVACVCGSTQRIVLANTGLTARDDYMVFVYESNSVSGNIVARLGNLVNWHITPNEQHTLDSSNVVTGMSCTLQHEIYNNGALVYTDVAQAYVQTTEVKSDEETWLSNNALMPLSSKSGTDTVNLFKYGKNSDGTAYAPIEMTLTGENATGLYHDLSVAQNNTINARVLLNAIRDTVTLEQPPTSGQLISAEYMLKNKNVPIHGNLDPKVFSSNNPTNYRCVIMDGGAVHVDSSTYYVYPVETDTTNGVKTAWGVGDTASEKGFGFVACFITTSWTSTCEKVDGTSLGNFYIALKTTSKLSASTYMKGVYSDVFGRYHTSSDNNPATGSLTAIGNTLLPNGNRLLTQYQEQSDAEKYVYRKWFALSDIPAVNNSGAFIENTTVKVWIKHESDPKPLFKINTSDYHAMSDSWKLGYLSTGSVESYLFFDDRDIELASRTAQLKVTFSSWELQNGDYVPRGINTTTDNKRIKVVVYEGWGTSASEICSAIFTGGPSIFEKQSGTTDWDISITGSGHMTTDPNNGLSPTTRYNIYQNGVFGYDVTITPQFTQTWSSPLARIMIQAVT